jgi:zinc protease
MDLAERYDILAELGRGGMGLVYKARDRETGAIVALKVLKPELADDPAIAARFRNELLLARRITHKNVCRIHDLGRAGDVAYISMELVVGETLREMLARRGRLPAAEVLALATQICAGLAEAHAAGVVHRDLKPDNVMVDSHGTVKLMDFGIARSVETTGNATIGVIGTPAYMSPEQASGGVADARSDVYSVGLILYELLTGVPTFAADGAIALAMKQMGEPPRRPREVEPTIAPQVELIVLRCLEKDPARRFDSATALDEALRSAGSGRPRSQVDARAIRPAIALFTVIVVVGLAVMFRPRYAAPIAIPFRQYTLANGLRVILAEDHAAPTVAVAMSYRVGSRDERPDQAGTAHLFEHMMFEGSQNVARSGHAALVRGAGGDENAATDIEHTTFYDVLPANQLELALFLEADRLRSLDVSESNFENQRNVVIQERRSRHSAPFTDTFGRLTAVAYPESPYSHQVYGSEADILGMRFPEVMAFHRAYYVPSNVVLTIVGDFRRAATLATVRKYFESIPDRAPPPRLSLQVHEQTAERRDTIEDPVTQTPRVDIGYRIPAAYTPDWYGLKVAAALLGGGESSPLYRRLVREGEVATLAAAFVDENAAAGLFRVVGQVRPGKESRQVELMLTEEVERLKTTPVSTAELLKAKRQLRRDLAQLLTLTVTRATQLGNAAAVYGDAGVINGIEGNIERVSAEDVQRVAQRYFTPRSRSVLLTVPGKARITAAQNQPEPVAPAPPLTPQGDAHRVSPPLAKDVLTLHLPRPTVFTLANGLAIMVVEDHRLPRVALTVSVAGAGPLYDPKGVNGLASLVVQALRDGTTSRTGAQIAEQIDMTGATLAASVNAGSPNAIVTATGLSESIDEWGPVVADVVRHPRFTPDQLNARRQRLFVQLRQQRASSVFLGDEQIGFAVFGEHPAALLALTPDALERVTVELLTDWHHEHYAPQQTTIGIVGDVNARDMRSKVERWFGDWPRTQWAPPVPADPPVPPGRRVILVDRPGQAVTRIIFGGMGIDRRSSDYPSMVVMNQVLGGNSAARLFLKLREELGFAFDAQSSFNAAGYRGAWRASTEVRAGVSDAALHAMDSELRRIMEEPVPAEELDRAKRSIVASFALTLERPTQVLGNWQAWKTYGFSDDYWDTYPAKIMAVTAEEVQQVARRYLDTTHTQLVVVGDAARLRGPLGRYGTVEIVKPAPPEE